MDGESLTSDTKPIAESGEVREDVEGKASEKSIPESAAAAASGLSECIICLEKAHRPVSLSCKCNFLCCQGCVLQWVLPSESTACPWCRRSDVYLVGEGGADLSDELYEEGRQLLQLFSRYSLARAARDRGEAQTNDQFNVSDEDFKQPLFEATDFFVKSISANRMNPKPYNGMAYMLLLVDNPAQSLRYTGFVLTQLDPQNSLALSLKKSAQKEPAPSSSE